MKHYVRTILIVCAIVVGSLLLLTGLSFYLSRQRVALLSEPPEHGTAFVIDADLSPAHGDTNTLAMLRETLRQRFSKNDTRIFWEPVSESRARLLVPIVDEKEVAGAKRLISRGGHLEFRLVHENSDQLVTNGEVPANYELLKHQETGTFGQNGIEMVVVKKKPELRLEGNIINKLSVTHDLAGAQAIIDFELKPESAAAFAEVTRSNIGRRLAIVLDDQIYSAPVIRTPIEKGNGRIMGNFDYEEALLLVNLMEHPLPVPVTLVDSKSF